MSGWVKKRLGPLRRGGGGALDGELATMRTRLANVAVALEACVAGLDAVGAEHARAEAGAARFARDFYALYPSDDGVRQLGREAAAAADALAAAGGAADAPALRGAAALERAVRAYLAEVRGLQREFKRAKAGAAEVRALEARVERADRRAAPPADPRRAALAAQARARRRAHDATTAALAQRVQGTYDKHADVFRAAWAAYFLKAGHRRALADHHLAAQTAQARRFERQLARVTRRPSRDAPRPDAAAGGACGAGGACSAG